ncbi:MULTISPECIES: hypothetical protein [Vibrio harveyi group]|nr:MULTISPECIES: hypothetical protein [Vibrio harveyi group]MCR9845791.1 hypothetical protein [Vibrio antiquarius]MCR9911269.1 hypothetical protein [Vibrio antiquarius]
MFRLYLIGFMYTRDKKAPTILPGLVAWGAVILVLVLYIPAIFH